MNSAIDATGSTLSFLGTKAQAAGGALALIPTLPSKILGGIILGAGIGMDFVGSKGKEAFKFANEILSTELAKTEKAFSLTTTSGAVFADSVDGMKNAAVAAGLNLAQFANLISKQSGDLAFSGMGVAEGARRVGEVGKIFNDNNGKIRKQLQRLGFTIEEQAELSATVMGNMARAGQSFDTKQLATETQRYAENLRLISALTGEDAKAKVKQVQEQNNIAAFQAELSKMGPKQAAQMDAAMATMSELERKALRDRVIFHGAVINEEAAIMESTNSKSAAMGREMYLKFLAGTLDTKSVAEIQGKYSQDTIKQFQNNSALNIAAYAGGNAAITAVQQDQLFQFQRAQKIMSGTVDKIVADQEQAKQPGGKLTEGFVEASSAAQQLSVQLEEILLPLLTEYTSATGDMLKGLRKLIDMAYGKGPTDKYGQTQDQKNLKETRNQANPFTTGPDFGKSDEEIDQWVEERKKKNAGTPTASSMPQTSSPTSKGKALGGISTGPVSGYTELLHGTEAVVPLADNRSIPVSLDSGSITAAVNQQSGILAEILRAMQNNNSISSQIAMNTV
jgi:hypothetical protein